MIFAHDKDLARRLERAEAELAAGCAAALLELHPESRAAAEPLAGGYAVYAGVGSPLTHAVGIGMQGAVTPKDMDHLEDFFTSHGARPTVELCPLADRSVLEQLGWRGYRLVEWSHLVARGLESVSSALQEDMPAVIEHLTAAGDDDTWSRCMARGFLGEGPVLREMYDIGRTLFRLAGCDCYLARVDGEPAGSAAVARREGVAGFFADSTRAPYRRRGIHAALIRCRLRASEGAGCDVAMATVAPGSESHRNYERAGFRLLYTRATMTLEARK